MLNNSKVTELWTELIVLRQALISPPGFPGENAQIFRDEIYAALPSS